MGKVKKDAMATSPKTAKTKKASASLPSTPATKSSRATVVSDGLATAPKPKIRDEFATAKKQRELPATASKKRKEVEVNGALAKKTLAKEGKRVPKKQDTQTKKGTSPKSSKRVEPESEESEENAMDVDSSEVENRESEVGEEIDGQETKNSLQSGSEQEGEEDGDSESEAELPPPPPKKKSRKVEPSDEEPDLPVPPKIKGAKAEKREENDGDTNQMDVDNDTDAQAKEEESIEDTSRAEAQAYVNRMEELMLRAEQLVSGEDGTKIPNVVDVLKGIDDGEVREEYATRLADCQLQILRRAKETLHFLRQLQSKNPPKQSPPVSSDVTLRDIEMDRRLPGAKQYSSTALWLEVSRSTNRALARSNILVEKLEDVREGIAPAEEEGQQQAVSTEGFRDVYVGMVTDAYAEDLDTLRKEATFDDKKIGLLIDCLESGMNIWDDLEKQMWKAHSQAGS
eukprot:comp23364_c0_seq1/m.38612 comp23364_c0_seq1/g.38612  ORF comp23364_c0_seq1/g.38612 comp23364_c0_seq1/m.38612 type:complete len:456 (-) comp23364_c0_seq1:629-1996(-)